MPKQQTDASRTQVRIIASAFAILLASLSIGCSQQVSSDELVGNYTAKYDYGTEQVRLFANGRYEQAFRVGESKASITNSGKWEFQNGNALVLHDSLLVDDYFGKLRPNYEEPVDGLRFLHVRKTLGVIYLDTNPDLPYSFRKEG